MPCPDCGATTISRDVDGYDECTQCRWTEYAATHSPPEPKDRGRLMLEKPKNPYDRYSSSPSGLNWHTWEEVIGLLWPEVERLEAENKDLRERLVFARSISKKGCWPKAWIEQALQEQ